MNMITGLAPLQVRGYTQTMTIFEPTRFKAGHGPIAAHVYSHESLPSPLVVLLDTRGVVKRVESSRLHNYVLTKMRSPFNSSPAVFWTYWDKLDYLTRQLRMREADGGREYALRWFLSDLFDGCTALDFIDSRSTLEGTENAHHR